MGVICYYVTPSGCYLLCFVARVTVIVAVIMGDVLMFAFWWPAIVPHPPPSWSVSLTMECCPFHSWQSPSNEPRASDHWFDPVLSQQSRGRWTDRLTPWKEERLDLMTWCKLEADDGCFTHTWSWVIISRSVTALPSEGFTVEFAHFLSDAADSYQTHM